MLSNVLVAYMVWYTYVILILLRMDKYGDAWSISNHKWLLLHFTWIFQYCWRWFINMNLSKYVRRTDKNSLSIVFHTTVSGSWWWHKVASAGSRAPLLNWVKLFDICFHLIERFKGFHIQWNLNESLFSVVCMLKNILVKS